MMRIWIDIDAAADAERLFGLHPVERHLRAIAKLTPAPEEVVLSGSAPLPDGTNHAVRAESGPAGARLADYLASADGPVIALDGGSFVDSRLLPLMTGGTEPVCLSGGQGEERTALLRLSPDIRPDREAETLRAVADRLAATRAAREVPLDELPSFVDKLRREVPFTLQAVPNAASRTRLERYLFKANYKGSTDFLTKWVFPPLVWPLVRLCTRGGVHPNSVTVLSIVLAVAAVPLFAEGMCVAGLAAAYAMAVLDSVDGKLARLTLTDSRIGDLLDHGLDIVHPPFWYIAWAWGLGMRGPGDSLFVPLIALLVFYVADRLVLRTAKRRFKRGLHAMTPLDGRVRTWIARRNTNLAIFTAGLALGIGGVAFVVIAAWQGLTLLWHAGRTAWMFPRGAVLDARRLDPERQRG